MYPENHNLVNNSFYDPDHDATYKIHDRTMVEDGSWYGGTPIWVQATKSGMVTASFFFVGSEADGLTDIWRTASSEMIKIPMLGQHDSMNVSNAAAVLLYEAVRQRINK